VSIVPRYGTFVTPLSLNDLKNLIQIRPTLEKLVVEILCDIASQSQINEMDHILQTAEQLIAENDNKPLRDTEIINDLRNLEAKLHNYMYNATQNPYLIYLCRQLQANSERYWVYANLDTNGLINQISDHRLLHDAIECRDKALSGKLAVKHTVNFTQGVLSSLTNSK
jgi:DNA-binding GntR family transcriptional regulator